MFNFQNKPMTTPRKAILVLSAINGILIAMVVHSTFFAAQGARYTFSDGEMDRAARIEGDNVLARRIGQQEERISALEKLLSEGLK